MIKYPTCHIDGCEKELTDFNEVELLTDKLEGGATYFCSELHAYLWKITEGDTNG